MVQESGFRDGNLPLSVGTAIGRAAVDDYEIGSASGILSAVRAVGGFHQACLLVAFLAITFPHRLPSSVGRSGRGLMGRVR